jgi:hypothetical protein
MKNRLVYLRLVNTMEQRRKLIQATTKTHNEAGF